MSATSGIRPLTAASWTKIPSTGSRLRRSSLRTP
nr:MAG TPA: hypothetical protein [Caudoviricetes sp.]DAN06212.1 MAG TPA: hypothetical protein [Caudoviricetes sp.]